MNTSTTYISTRTADHLTLGVVSLELRSDTRIYSDEITTVTHTATMAFKSSFIDSPRYGNRLVDSCDQDAHIAFNQWLVEFGLDGAVELPECQADDEGSIPAFDVW